MRKSSPNRKIERTNEKGTVSMEERPEIQSASEQLTAWAEFSRLKRRVEVVLKAKTQTLLPKRNRGNVKYKERKKRPGQKAFG